MELYYLGGNYEKDKSRKQKSSPVLPLSFNSAYILVSCFLLCSMEK